MIDAIETLFDNAPLLALFLTISIGYLVGKIKLGTFVLGGIAGTLIVGVAIGQFGVTLSDDLKTAFFALFIYAVGFQGGPQFVNSLNKESIGELASAATMAVVGLLVVLGSAFLFNLDRGTAAGLAAGGLTQSAIIGTADEAIAELPNVSSDQVEQMQANVAVGYAITYIFGQIGPIIAITWLFPRITGWNLRKEARSKAARMSGGRAELEPGEVDAVELVQTRFFEASAGSEFTDTSVADIDDWLSEAAVELVAREGSVLENFQATTIEEGDVVGVTGYMRVLDDLAARFGREVVAPAAVDLVEERRDVVITSDRIAGHTFAELRDGIAVESRRGVFPTGLRRMGHDMPVLDDVQIDKGDEVVLTGRPTDLDAVTPAIGYTITAKKVTDFIFFGLGLAIGVGVGLLSWTIGEVPITLGTGGGCLVSGLFFGWLRSTHPRFAALPVGASNFLRDFGLAVFVGVVGLTAGPEAISALEDNGIQLFLLGIVATMLPMLIVFPITYYVYRIKDPIDSLSSVAGGRSANPGFAALLEKAGNATPVAAFTITYALANILLTVWGPLIVGIVPTNAG